MSATKLNAQIKDAQYPYQSNKDTCNVYRNILFYLENRGYTVLQKPYPVMKAVEFIKHMSSHSHIDIFGVKDSPVSAIIQISLMFPNGKLSKIDAALHKFIENEVDKLNDQHYQLKEYIVVTSTEVKGQGISRVQLIEGTEIQKYDNRDINVVVLESTAFLVNIAATDIFKNHSIIDIEEVRQHLDEMYIKDDSIPKISSKDNMVIWLGAKIGDYIRILRPSPSSCYTVVYRRVILL